MQLQQIGKEIRHLIHRLDHPTDFSTPVSPHTEIRAQHLVALDGVVDTERDAVEVAAVGLLGASAVEDQLVLGVADVDVRRGAAGVGAGGIAVGRAARALHLGNGLAVRDASDVGALAAVRAGSDGLKYC